MTTLRVFIPILLFALVFGGEGQAAQGRGPAPDAKIETEVRQAGDLLDSWRGQGDALEQAKGILDRVLKREPENYRALKELARYHIMNGYLSSNKKTNAGNVYTVNQFKPGTLEKAEGILRTALRV